ncbi:MAG: EAL domain-containing protein [Mogibacterium sp.]|nr:EAL domain-containing protein [Mogibacterium sp.]
MNSIRGKITLITIAAILISALSVAAAAFFTIGEEYDRASAESMNLLSRNMEQTLDEYLESIEQSVEMAANIAGESLDSFALVEGGVVGSAGGGNKRTSEQKKTLDSYLAKHCDRVQQAFSSVASHTHGVITYYYCISPEISGNEHGFFYSKVGKSGFEEQEPLDATKLDPGDTEHTTWYYTPIKRGRPSWVGPYKAHFLNELWTLSYLVPIYKSGTLIGVLGMDVEFETLVSQIRPLSVYKTGFACLLDEEGNILYHPEIGAGSIPDYIGVNVAEDILTAENSGDELITYTIEGQEKKLAFSTLSSGMKLIVTAPSSEIDASWRHLTGSVMVITAAIAALFALIMMFAVGIIIGPLAGLTAASSRLADGDYDVELEYRSNDEVGKLTAAFIRMRDNIKSYIDDLNRKVISDDLTGLPNMRHFFDLAEARIRQMKEAGKTPVILYLNLSGLKYFNRQYGFEEGDRLICAVADILREHFGEENCSRLGRDHLTALGDEEGINETIGQIIDECGTANSGRTLPVRIGVYPDRFDEVDISVACDRAKYACDLNRNSYISECGYFDSNMLEQTRDFHYIINNLDRALEENWVKVFYQPIVDARKEEVCDEEALSRWFDPERGLISPGVFIPVLENARLIYKLDLYVLDHVLRKMQCQKKNGLRIISNSINLSRVDFEVCDIVEEVCRRVDASGIPREYINIELTESAVGKDFEFIKSQAERLRDLGFKVWMDDFGSGYSSLDVLQDIHFDVIKFDMRFMQRFGESNDNRIIVTELIDMAKGLNIRTVIEGVETKEQAEFVRNAGCTMIQGFYYGKAAPFSEPREEMN